MFLSGDSCGSLCFKDCYRILVNFSWVICFNRKYFIACLCSISWVISGLVVVGLDVLTFREIQRSLSQNELWNWRSSSLIVHDVPVLNSKSLDCDVPVSLGLSNALDRISWPRLYREAREIQKNRNNLESRTGTAWTSLWRSGAWFEVTELWPVPWFLQIFQFPNCR